MLTQPPAAPPTIQHRLFSGPYLEPEPVTLLAHGAGQDSSAMLIRVLLDPDFRERWVRGRLLVVCADTNDEHAETYDHIPEMAALCAEHGVPYEHLTADKGFHTRTWRGLTEFYDDGARIGSKSFPKACSMNLKVLPQYRWLAWRIENDYGLPAKDKRGFYELLALTGHKIRVLIGFSAEEDRVDRRKDVPKWMKECVERVYPLTEIGWTREDCKRYIRHMGFTVPYPSLCRHCPYKTPFDIAYMHRFDPEGLEAWIRREQRKLAKWADELPPEKNHGVFPGKTLPEVLEKALAEFGSMTDHEMHERRMAGHGGASRH